MILVFGANGLLGRAICEYLPNEQVTAVLRQPNQDPFFIDKKTIIGDALHISDCQMLIQQTQPNVIISVISGKTETGEWCDDKANINIIQAASLYAPQAKMVLVTSIGCGEQWSKLSPTFQQAVGDCLQAKTKAENYLQQTTLNWLIIRPSGLNNEALGKYQLVTILPEQRPRFISRKTVAKAIIDLLQQQQNHKVYSVLAQEGEY